MGPTRSEADHPTSAVLDHVGPIRSVSLDVGHRDGATIPEIDAPPQALISATTVFIYRMECANGPAPARVLGALLRLSRRIATISLP
jgi:hypothetical protein